MGSWTASALRSARRRDRIAIQPVQYGYRGPLAQRLEQRTHNPLVEGSNPSGPTNNPLQFSSLLLGAEGACCPSSAGVPGSVPVSRVSARACVAPARRRCSACARSRGFENATPRLLFLVRCPRRAGVRSERAVEARRAGAASKLAPAGSGLPDGDPSAARSILPYAWAPQDQRDRGPPPQGSDTGPVAQDGSGSEAGLLLRTPGAPVPPASSQPRTRGLLRTSSS